MRLIRIAAFGAAIAMLAIFSSSFSGSAQAVVPPFGAPSITVMCGGYNSDVINVEELPEGVVVTDDTGWFASGTRFITVAAAEGFSLSPGQQTTFTYYDSGYFPCPVTASPPIQSPVCGDNNDLLNGVQQEGLLPYSGPIFWSNNQFNYTYQAEFGYVITGPSSFLMIDAGPCVTDPPVPPVVNPVCGVNNDEIVVSTQPIGVGVTSSNSWIEGEWIVQYMAAPGYVLPEGAQTTYVFTDSEPCITEAPLAPSTVEVCGENNDEVVIPLQPEGVLVDSPGAWSNGSWTITFSAAEGYVLPTDTQTEYALVDSGPCVTEAPAAPIVTEVCGTDNDIVEVPTQPVNVLVNSDDAWLDSMRTVTFSAADGYFIPADAKTEYTFVDSGPCVTEAPVAPIVTEVCGADDDIVEVPTQPANVLVSSDDAWLDGMWTVTFSAAENYILPADTQTEFTFTDVAVPCPTDAPIPPVQVAACGPDNDELVFPDAQPDGVTLESDTDWVNGERTVTYAIPEGNVITGETVFTFTDQNTPCPTEEPVTQPVVVQLLMPDDGTAAGTAWQLYTETAAQAGTGLVAEGVVDSDDQIQLGEMLPGTYQLLVNIDGYVPVDTVLEITAETTYLEVPVALLQPEPTASPETPTPEPTGTPETPTPEPTVTPVPTSPTAPTMGPTAPVTGLPSTGSGPGNSALVFGLAAFAGAGLSLFAVESRRRNSA